MASDLTQVRAMHGRGDGAPVGVRGGYTGRESPPSQARVASSSGTDCASDAGGGAAALITSCVAHVSVKRRRRCPGTVPPGRNARRRGFSLWKVPQIPKNFQRPGALPPDPRQHTVQLLCCAALARAKKTHIQGWWHGRALAMRGDFARSAKKILGPFFRGGTLQFWDGGPLHQGGSVHA